MSFSSFISNDYDDDYDDDNDNAYAVDNSLGDDYNDDGVDNDFEYNNIFAFQKILLTPTVVC